MYALVNYKGEQIKIVENEKIRIPYQKDLKIGSKIKLDQVLFYDNGKTKKVGTPYIKSISFNAKVDSHSKDTKIIVFKKKRRKGHQKKNGHKQQYTLLHINKFIEKKAASKVVPKKNTSKKTVKKKVTKTTKKDK